LFFPGDVGSFDSRGQEIARSVVALLQRLGVSFGILGNQEISDGNEANAMGETDLFRLLAEENIRHFKELKVRKIIALSPHGFNALKNDYPALGGTYQVFHYSQILAAHRNGLSFQPDLPGLSLTYHDACYLGRHNGEYQSARQVLAAIPGVELREMDRHLQNALCCGGGGGNLFTDILGHAPESPTQNRILEALDTGADILAVSCPTCAVMLTDAVKSLNMEDRIHVQEISEIVNQRLALSIDSDSNP
jgi:Fe-S oxidoreductase